MKNKSGLIDPNHYANVFVTSDLHFGHENVLSYEQSRIDSLVKTKFNSEWITNHNYTIEDLDNNFDELRKQWRHEVIKEHDEQLIKNWNSVVKDKDLIYILGDLSMKNGKYTNEILKQLNGDKILIKGNHDYMFLEDHKFNNSLINEIYEYKEIKYKKNLIILFHFPIQVWNKAHKGTIHLYGHIHSNKTTSHPMKYEIENSYNVGVDVNNYKPVRLDNYINNYNRLKEMYEQKHNVLLL